MDTNINQPETTLSLPINRDDLIARRVDTRVNTKEPLTFSGMVNDSIDTQLEILRNNTFKTAIEPKSWFEEDESSGECLLRVKPMGRVLKRLSPLKVESLEHAILILEAIREWETNEFNADVEELREKWNTDSRFKNKKIEDVKEVA